MVEPTPGHWRQDVYVKDGARVVAYVNERGIVECSAEFIAEVMKEAGWEHEEP